MGAAAAAVGTASWVPASAPWRCLLLSLKTSAPAGASCTAPCWGSAACARRAAVLSDWGQAVQSGEAGGDGGMVSAEQQKESRESGACVRAWWTPAARWECLLRCTGYDGQPWRQVCYGACAAQMVAPRGRSATDSGPPPPGWPPCGSEPCGAAQVRSRDLRRSAPGGAAQQSRRFPPTPAIEYAGVPHRCLPLLLLLPADPQPMRQRQASRPLSDSTWVQRRTPWPAMQLIQRPGLAMALLRHGAGGGGNSRQHAAVSCSTAPHSQG